MPVLWEEGAALWQRAVSNAEKRGGKKWKKKNTGREKTSVYNLRWPGTLIFFSGEEYVFVYFWAEADSDGLAVTCASEMFLKRERAVKKTSATFLFKQMTPK